VENCILYIVHISRFNPNLYYKKVLKLYIHNCTTIILIFSWIIIYIINNIYLKKIKKIKAKLKTLSFIYFYILKVYFNFTICLFNLYIIIIIKYI